MIYVLDASVIVKWFVEEPDTPQALSLKTAYLEGACEVASLDFARALHTAVVSLRRSTLLAEFSPSQ